MFSTLAEVYKNSVEKYADRVCNAMFEREEITFRQFDERVRELQGLLLEAGLNPGDKVALLSSSMPNWPVCYFAVVEMGLVVAIPLRASKTAARGREPARGKSGHRRAG